MKDTIKVRLLAIWICLCSNSNYPWAVLLF